MATGSEQKIPSTAENWDNRVLGADPKYARPAPPEADEALERIIPRKTV